MTLRTTLLAVILLVGIASGCTTASLMNIVDRPVAVGVDGTGRSVEDVQAAVIGACKNRGWIPSMEDEAQVNCSISVRGRHYAEVLIPFSGSSFSILHSSSEGLNYNPSRQTIHRNYNRWVANLAQEVQRELGKR